VVARALVIVVRPVGLVLVGVGAAFVILLGCAPAAVPPPEKEVPDVSGMAEHNAGTFAKIMGAKAGEDDPPARPEPSGVSSNEGTRREGVEAEGAPAALVVAPGRTLPRAP